MNLGNVPFHPSYVTRGTVEVPVTALSGGRVFIPSILR